MAEFTCYSELLDEHAVFVTGVEHFHQSFLKLINLGVHVLVACHTARVVIERDYETVAVHQ
jgi:hypothetical protein